VLALALIAWQALGFPEVEDPIPDKIGLGSIIGLAGACGLLAGVVSMIIRPGKRERFAAVGTFAGCCLGICLYAISLLVQLLFDS
jgi:hypothetical protein